MKLAFLLLALLIPMKFADNTDTGPEPAVMSCEVEVVQEAIETIETEPVIVETEPVVETEPTEPPFVSSDPSITFTYEYVDSENNTHIPYGLYTPSTAETNSKTPLIIWLHGLGEINKGQTEFSYSGLLYTLNRWKLDGFNAYVACPQLYSDYNTNAWMKDAAVGHIAELIEHLTNKYNIDTSRIILCGHSLGGQGSTYIASKLPNTFSCVAVLSGYNCWAGELPIDAPVIGYVGTPAAYEDENSYYYMVNKFKEEYPDATVNVMNVSHGEVPYYAFTSDVDKDNKSDLIEWMLSLTR